MLVYLNMVSFFPRLTAVTFGKILNLIPQSRENASGLKCLTPCPALSHASVPAPPGSAPDTHHFVVDLMEMNFTHFFHNVFTFKCDKPKS